MPSYQYKCAKCGKTSVRHREVAARRRTFPCSCGGIMHYDFVGTHAADGFVVQGTWAKPIVSEAAGVHPEQINEAKAYDRSHGLSVEYTPDGRPVFTNRSERRRYLAAHHMHDLQGGNGD